MTISETSTAPDAEGTLLGAVATTWHAAPPRLRRTIVGALGAWLAVACLQVLDVRHREGLHVTAELVSVLAGTAGILLMAVGHLLQQTNGGGVPRQILPALPVFAYLAGALLAFAIAAVIVRGISGGPLALVIPSGILYATMLVLACSVVMRTTRALHQRVLAAERAVADARSQAAEAQLLALQSQMNPHFLFNALNTVAALVRTDARAAEATIENLAGVLRRTLQRAEETQSTVGQEVDYVQAYLAIEQQRFGARLRVTWAVPPATRAQPLPPFVLQPLIENAIRHGIASRIEGGTIRVAVEQAGARLRLTVADDGPGFPAASAEHTGLGNLRRRLESRYGDAASLAIETTDRGARVQVEVPWVEVAHASADRR